MDTPTLDAAVIETDLHQAAQAATASSAQAVAQTTPPPLQLPRELVAHLAKPFETLEDVDRLIAHIRICEWRGLL